MKFNAALCAGVLTLALAACSGGEVTADADGDGEVSAAEAEAAVAASGTDFRLEAGKYKATAQFVGAENMPAEMEQMMSGIMTTSYDYCITPEMSEQGFEEMMKSGQSDGCKIDKMNLNSGSIDVAMSCDADEDGAIKMAMKGDVTSTSANYTMTMSGMTEMMGEGSITVDVTQERIGECD